MDGTLEVEEHSPSGCRGFSILCNRGIDRCIAREQLSPASPQCQLLLQQGRYRSELRAALEQHLPSIQERDVVAEAKTRGFDKHPDNLQKVLGCLVL